MSATTIRYKGKVVNHDPMTNPENGYVEGFYYQDLDNGVVKHYIFNCPMIWEVDPATVRIIRHDDLPNYENPVTTTEDIKELQQRPYRLVLILSRNATLPILMQFVSMLMDLEIVLTFVSGHQVWIRILV